MATELTSPPHDPARLEDAFRTITTIAVNRLGEEDKQQLVDALEAVIEEYTRLHCEDIRRIFAEVNALLQRHLSCTPGESASV